MTSSGTDHVILEAATSLAPSAQASNPKSLFSGVTVSARGGCSLVLLGPNGCGKTSVARALLGLAPLSSGRRTAQPGVRFAYMPQDYRNAFFPWLTLEKNIGLRLRHHVRGPQTDLASLTSAEMAALYQRLETEVDLRRYPDEVSGGQLQLILFVATMVMPADVRVLDEPFSALDFRRRAIASEMLSERAATTPSEAWIVITHDIAEGVQLANQVAIFSTARSISAQIEITLPWPRGSGVRETSAGLSAIRTVREAIGLA